MPAKPESALAESMLNAVALQELIDWREAEKLAQIREQERLTAANRHLGQTAIQTEERATA